MIAKVKALTSGVPAVQMICEVGKAVGAEGLVAGQIVDIKSEGQGKKVCLYGTSICKAIIYSKKLDVHRAQLEQISLDCAGITVKQT